MVLHVSYRQLKDECDKIIRILIAEWVGMN